MTAGLTPRARAHLRRLAHGLAPVVQVGAAGITPAVARAATVALEDHELVKVRLPKGLSAAERKEQGRSLAAATASLLVQQLGRVVVLYRRRGRDDPGRRRIELPC